MQLWIYIPKIKERKYQSRSLHICIKSLSLVFECIFSSLGREKEALTTFWEKLKIRHITDDQNCCKYNLFAEHLLQRILSVIMLILWSKPVIENPKLYYDDTLHVYLKQPHHFPRLLSIMLIQWPYKKIRVVSFSLIL